MGQKNAVEDLPRRPARFRLHAPCQLPSPLPPMRLMMRQSGCFRFVDRNAGIEAAKREKALDNSGIMRRDQTVRKRKVIEARHSRLTIVVFSDRNAGETFGGLVSRLPVVDQYTGWLDNINFKEAQTVLFLTDNETSE